MPEQIKHISVLMPAYNSGKFISASIKSILNQTFREFEFIIIDDGSTDNTEEIVKTFKDSRIRYFRTENKGTSAALNYGLNLCSSEYTARIDSDDLNVPERLEKQIRYLEQNPDTDILSSWSVYFRDPCKILFLLREPTEHDEIYEYLNLHNPLNQSALIFKKNVIVEAGYREEYLSNEDFELFYRIRDKAKFKILPEFLVYTRVRGDAKSYRFDQSSPHDFLFKNAFKNMIDAKSKGEHFYWASNIAWINFFFGNKVESRSYFKNSFSAKNFAAYLSTFLPQNSFNKLIDSRLKYRLRRVFSSVKEQKRVLNKLLV